MSEYLLPPGFKDEIFDEASLEHKYKNLIINLFQSNGYELVKPPLIEYLNSKNNKNTFIIKEKNENNEFVIRNDITLQIARLANARFKSKLRPLKLCYYGEVIRKKGSILRPERQFLQVGAECIGEKNYLADVEMLELAYQALTLIGINDISIELSSSEFLNYILRNNKSKKELKNLAEYVKRKDVSNCLRYLDSSLHNYLMNLLSCTGSLSEKKEMLDKLVVNQETKIAKNQLLDIYNNFKNKSPNVNFFLDLTESDYLDYHTGTRFTFFAKNVRGEIARGGRYISKYESELESSTGFTCYMDTIIRASSFEEKNKKILVPFNIRKETKKDLIKKGYIIDTYFGDDNHIKQKAQQKKIPFCFVDNSVISIF